MPLPESTESVSARKILSFWSCRPRCRILDFPIAEQVIEVPPRSLALRVHRVLLFLNRSQRNSWWKCRPCCLPRASLCRSRSRSSAFQLLGVVFKVFSHNRVQQRRLLIWNAFLSGLWSRSLTFLLLVVALDRGLPHLLVLQMRILLCFSHFSPGQKKCDFRSRPESERARQCQLMDRGGL